MEKDIEQSIMGVLSLDRRKKVQLGKLVLESICAFLKDEDCDDDTVLQIITGIARIFISTRKKCTKKVHKLFLDILSLENKNYSYEAFSKVIEAPEFKNFEDDAYEIIETILPTKCRIDTAIFGAILLGTYDSEKLSEKAYDTMERVMGPIAKGPVN